MTQYECPPARFSPCRRYRYTLARRVGLGIEKAVCLFIMLNPSTADENLDDPTIRRCMGFARVWGYGILMVGNLFAFRSTDPRELSRSRVEPVGVDNDLWLVEMALQADLTVAAWGNGGGLDQRSRLVREMLYDQGVKLHTFGLTQRGEPRHPLYIRREQELVQVESRQVGNQVLLR